MSQEGNDQSPTRSETEACLFGKNQTAVVVVLLLVVVVQSIVLCMVACNYFQKKRRHRKSGGLRCTTDESDGWMPKRFLGRWRTFRCQSSTCKKEQASCSDISLEQGNVPSHLVVEVAPPIHSAASHKTALHETKSSASQATRTVPASPHPVRSPATLRTSPPSSIKAHAGIKPANSCPTDLSGQLQRNDVDHEYASLHRDRRRKEEKQRRLEDSDGYLEPVEEPEPGLNEPTFKRYAHIYDEPPKTPDGELDKYFRRSLLRYTLPTSRRVDILRALRYRAGSENAFQVVPRTTKRRAAAYKSVLLRTSRSGGASPAAGHQLKQYTKPLKSEPSPRSAGKPMSGGKAPKHPLVPVIRSQSAHGNALSNKTLRYSTTRI